MTNPFPDLLRRLPLAETQLCLQEICRGRGYSLDALQAATRVATLLNHLEHLVAFKLIKENGPHWIPTWLGRGVYHWNQQLFWADLLQRTTVPAPTQGENGALIAGVCHTFRPLFCRSGYCWCGRLHGPSPGSRD
jgi:hypothetical protein